MGPLLFPTDGSAWAERARPWAERLVLGSVAEGLVRRAALPVLVVRPGADGDR